MTDRMERFAREYLIDLNASAAAQRAGYRNPLQIGSRLKNNPEVAALIQKLMDTRSAKVGITAEMVLEGIKECADRCMIEEAFNPAAALKAYELLGKHLKLFTDKTETEMSGGLTIGWDNGTGDDSV